MQLKESTRILCRENSIENLLAELALHRVDMVLADGPIPPGIDIRGFNHPLGDSGISFFGIPELAAGLSDDFANSLSGQ